MHDFATHHPCLLLCHAFVRIRQSPTTRKATNRNPSSSESPLLQKRSTHRPQRLFTRICRLPQRHLRNAEKRREERHNDPNGIRRHHPLPSPRRRRHRPSDPIVPGINQRHPHLRHLEVRLHRPHHVKANRERVARRRLGNWGRLPPHCTHRDRHALHPFGGCHGNVPWRLPRLPHHDDRPLVKRRIPPLHSEAGRRIQPRRLEENAHPHVPSSHSQLFIPNSFPPRSQATQPSRQRRDSKKRRWRRGSTSQTACLFTVSLSSTIVRGNIIHSFHFISSDSSVTHRYLITRIWRKHLFWCRRSRAGGISNHY